MARPRLQLHDILVGIMKEINPQYEKNHVYFQPPSTIKMQYPCIVYARNTADTKFADNRPYIYHVRYTITVIDKDPDSLIPDKVAALPLCTADRHYVSDNLNHDTYNLYF